MPETRADPAVKADIDQIAVADRDFMSTRPSTTLAECVFATVFQGFAFGNMGTAEAVAEG